jgi:transcriptional regulator with XRE-family HTH domain
MHEPYTKAAEDPLSRGAFGERLRREREMRGVSVEEISSATRISTRFLLALENEQWNQLPGGIFNRGFIRAVARYLGLDEEALVAEYALATNDRPSVAVWVEPPTKPEHRARPWLLLLLLLVAIGAGGWYAWREYGAMILAWRQPAIAPPPKPAPPPVAPEAASAIESKAAEPDTLELKIEVSEPRSLKVLADGKQVFEGSVRPGRSRTFTAIKSFEVSADNSSGVLLYLNGQLMGAIGLPDSPGNIKLDRNELKKAPGGTN